MLSIVTINVQWTHSQCETLQQHRKIFEYIIWICFLQIIIMCSVNGRTREKDGKMGSMMAKDCNFSRCHWIDPDRPDYKHHHAKRCYPIDSKRHCDAHHPTLPLLFIAVVAAINALSIHLDYIQQFDFVWRAHLFYLVKGLGCMRVSLCSVHSRFDVKYVCTKIPASAAAES